MNSLFLLVSSLLQRSCRFQRMVYIFGQRPNGTNELLQEFFLAQGVECAIVFERIRG